VHRVDAKPSLIARARSADLVFATGAELEIGWLPVLLQEAGNAHVQPGSNGYFEATSQVQLLDKPTSVDRSMGDIHPQGNPHIQLDPHNIAKVAAVLATRLAKIDAAHAATYQQRGRDFDAKWTQALARWDQRIAPLKGMQIVTHHRSYVYLDDWAGLEEVGSLEPKPGIEPSTGHLSELLDQIKTKHVKAIVRAVYESDRASQWLAGRTHIKAIVIPHTVGAVPGTDDLFGLFDTVTARLVEANR
jgi:zinc/manganese transport system substrate-binding protein